jgi:hypothetical protein
MSAKKMLSPGSGANFGLRAGNLSARGNPVPYLLPWAAAFALLILAVAVRFGLAQDSMSWYWSAFVVIVYTGLTYVTWRASRARGALACGLATGGMALASAWSWYMAGAPGLSWRPFVIYAGLAIVFCAGANMFVVFSRRGGESEDMHDKVTGAVTKMRNINEIESRDGQVVARYEMEPGTPAADLQKDAASLASLYGVAPDGVRVLPDRDNARVGELRVSPTNPLRHPQPWPGPSIRTGGSPMDPVRVGIRRGGQPQQLWLPGDPKVGRNASLIQVTGMSGAGKTEFIRYLLVEGVLSRGMPDEIEYWYGNSRKADQEPEWVEQGAARFERDRKGVAAMLRDLRDEAPQRARILGQRGLDQWQPGCGLAFRLVVLDEFADVASDVERLLVDLAETLRSLGVVLLCGFQRASGDRFPTSARSNFGSHVCFGVKDDMDASMALPDEVLEAGAQPWIWGNKVPGMCYLTAPGVPEDLWTDEARTYKPNRELLGKWAEHYITARNTAAATAGPAQPPATDHTTAPARRPSPYPRPVDAEQAVADPRDQEGLDDVFDLDEDFDEELAADEVDDVLQEIDDELGDGDLDDFDDPDLQRPHVPQEEAEVVHLDHREPIPVGHGGGMRLALSPQMPPRQARTHVRGFLARLHADGVERFKKEDIGGELLSEVGYKASWLDKVLSEFAAERPEWLRRTDERGWYDIVASPTPEIERDAA